MAINRQTRRKQTENTSEVHINVNSLGHFNWNFDIGVDMRSLFFKSAPTVDNSIGKCKSREAIFGTLLI